MFGGIKKHHILFGLGALATGYYLYKKKLEQEEAADEEVSEEENLESEDSPQEA